MDIFHKNIADIERYRQGLMAVLQGAGDLDDYGLVRAANGQPNLVMRRAGGGTFFLHNVDNPSSDASRCLDTVPPEATGVVCFLGMGLGYGPLRLSEERPHVQHIAIIELDQRVFLHALRAVDLTPLFSDPRVTLKVGPDPDVQKLLDRAARSIQLEHTYVLRHLPCFEADWQGYRALDKAVMAYVNHLNVSGATAMSRGRTFVENRFRNLSGMRHQRFLDCLEGAFQGVPAILVAGGPSLDKNIDLLAEAQERAVIFAVDSVLPALAVRGIRPDFVSALDSDDVIYEKVADAGTRFSALSLICLSEVTPKIPKIFPAKWVFWAMPSGPMQMWLKDALGAHFNPGDCQTVAHLNLSAAILMGCSPIIFVGQDLAYTGGKDHASHTVLTSAEQMERLIADGQNVLWVDGVNGEKVLTDRGFWSMKRIFEERIAAAPGRYINATEGGARIDGTEVMSLREAIDASCREKRCVRGVICDRFEKAVAPNMDALVKTLEKTRGVANSLTDKIKRMSQKIRAAQRRLGNLEGGHRPAALGEFPSRLQSIVLDIDRLNGVIEQESSFWRVIQELTLDVLRDTERARRANDLLRRRPGGYGGWLEAELKRYQGLTEGRRRVVALFGGMVSRSLDRLRREDDLLGGSGAGPEDPHARLALAGLYFESQDFGPARPWLERCLTEAHLRGEASFLLGCIATWQMRFTEASSLFSEAAALDRAFESRRVAFMEDLARQYLDFAKVLESSGTAPQKRMLRKALQFCPDFLPAQDRLAALVEQDLERVPAVLDSSDFSLALSLLDECLQDLPCNADLHLLKGQILAKQDRYAEAVEAFQRAVDLSPGAAQAHLGLADACLRIERVDRAFAALREAVGLDSRYAVCWEEVGDKLVEARNLEGALAAYEAGFLNLPSEVALLKKMGRCYVRIGRFNAAREAYVQCHKRLPGDEEAVFALRRLERTS